MEFNVSDGLIKGEKMTRQVEIFIDKLYRYDRVLEHCYVGFPLQKGFLKDEEKVTLYDPENKKMLPSQIKVTSRYEDGSIRFIFIRFLADIPANRKTKFICNITSDSCGDISNEQDNKVEMLSAFNAPDLTDTPYNPISVVSTESGFIISTVDDTTKAPFSYEVKNDSAEIFDHILVGKRNYGKDQLVGPVLKKDGDTNVFSVKTGTWKVVENGPLCAILKTKGSHIKEETGEKISFELKLTAWAGKPYTEVSYRIINDTDEPLKIKSLKYHIRRNPQTLALNNSMSCSDTENNLCSADFDGNSDKDCMSFAPHLDSTGCGDNPTGEDFGDGPLYHVSNSADADRLVSERTFGDVRSITAASNYKTDYYLGKDGAPSKRVIDSEYLMKEANEHFAEVFYGTFFADCTDSEGGVCATIFQAQQNYPKAVSADKNGSTLYLVPENIEEVVLESGMSREQKFLLHFHPANESISSLNDRSIVYQMPYRPYVSPKVHKESGVWPEIFAPEVADSGNLQGKESGDRKHVFSLEPDPYLLVERSLIARADTHSRAYGMLNFGDSYDSNYTAQGRGGGKLVWCNNEYDYPHACALLFARTGIRRFLDYNIASVSHWMDVDVCHYHKDPLFIGGQWEHTAGHVQNGVMVCSHEWVEGLLDYYHFTGDERGLETAIGIGENVMRLLDLPMYQKAGESNARETGWALRTLTALYTETSDKKWLVKCEKILNDFKIWEKQYGHWLAPYTDNTVIRVGFMISVAVGSLARYYRQLPDDELKGLILRAVDDLTENCYEENHGIFYYKELPSLNRLGNNTLLLEALTIAYDLSGDPKYLEYGKETFKNAVSDSPSYTSAKKKIENSVIVGSASSKNFAQSMIPIAGFFRAVAETVSDQNHS